MAKTKECPFCKETYELSVDNFNRDRYRKDGFSYLCKSCINNISENKGNAESTEIQYALYAGDEFLATGTIEEISKQINMSIKTLRNYGSPSYLKRSEGRAHTRKVLIRLSYDGFEEKECKSCKEVFPLTKDFWHVDKRLKDGFNNECKSCKREKAREYQERKRKLEGFLTREELEAEEVRLQRARTREMEKLSKERLEKRKNKMRGETYNPKKTYRVDNRKNVVRNVRDLVDFTGKVHYQDGRLLTLKHKNGRCETFLKVDFKIGEYQIEELY